LTLDPEGKGRGREVKGRGIADRVEIGGRGRGEEGKGSENRGGKGEEVCFFQLGTPAVDEGSEARMARMELSLAGGVQAVFSSLSIVRTRRSTCRSSQFLLEFIRIDKRIGSWAVAARRSVTPGANAHPAAPPCPRSTPSRLGSGEFPSVRMGRSPGRR